MGDPGGIGAEVLVKAAARREVQAAARLLVLGSRELLEREAKAAGVTLTVEEVLTADEANQLSPGHIAVLKDITGETFTHGLVSAENGIAAHRWITLGVELVRSGDAAALCTAPISKEAMYRAGFHFPGHTELLAELCGGAEVRMMLEAGGIHAVLQTIHVALTEVPQLINRGSILRTLEIMHAWGKTYQSKSPRIAVCGLNPHAGENGHFGREEIDVIRPAVEEAAVSGINAMGPYPADTIFWRARQGEFDLVLAMYHDQALIPVKTLDFHGGVNVTIGLPIIRTSPDHGTAFEIAGQGIANESSMVAALLRAAELGRRAW